MHTAVLRTVKYRPKFSPEEGGGVCRALQCRGFFSVYGVIHCRIVSSRRVVEIKIPRLRRHLASIRVDHLQPLSYTVSNRPGVADRRRLLSNYVSSVDNSSARRLTTTRWSAQYSHGYSVQMKFRNAARLLGAGAFCSDVYIRWDRSTQLRLWDVRRSYGGRSLLRPLGSRVTLDH